MTDTHTTTYLRYDVIDLIPHLLRVISCTNTHTNTHTLYVKSNEADPRPPRH